VLLAVVAAFFVLLFVFVAAIYGFVFYVITG
jgi:hypothetical protein